MKYKLKEGKQLTREDLINTKWKLKSKDEHDALYSLSTELGFSRIMDKIDMTRGFLYFYKGLHVVQNKIDNFSINIFQGDNYFKQMNFDDYFEEDELINGKENNSQQENNDSNKNLVCKIHPAGSFMWAVEQMKQMKQGKKVKRRIWEYTKPIALDLNNTIAFPDKTNYALYLDDIEATDWEIFEENVFGDYEVTPDGELLYHNTGGKLPVEIYQFDNLEKAIKRARESQC